MVLDFGNGGGRSLLQDLLVVVSLGCGSSAADDRLWLCRVLDAGGCEVTETFRFCSLSGLWPYRSSFRMLVVVYLCLCLAFASCCW
ncbi:expressed protein [Arabidopsis lyrata subsp. lyrata]|uniref:Expressed protein n=1 Tax=Arabidopsis lyrata subsp. lyrata TaxID=81972 RepID=D7MJJ3_ARALL|nr:expressed protein [Arabidopsis lyrata subsp. lyrata]